MEMIKVTVKVPPSYKEACKVLAFKSGDMSTSKVFRDALEAYKPFIEELKKLERIEKKSIKSPISK